MLYRNHTCLIQDTVFFSFLIYLLATSFFILSGSLFNAMNTILIIGLEMDLAAVSETLMCVMCVVFNGSTSLISMF